MKSKLHEQWYAAAEARGKIEGALKALRETSMILLSHKFPHMTETMNELLQKLDDPVRMRKLFDYLLEANTEEEFRALAGV